MFAVRAILDAQGCTAKARNRTFVQERIGSAFGGNRNGRFRQPKGESGRSFTLPDWPLCAHFWSFRAESAKPKSVALEKNSNVLERAAARHISATKQLPPISAGTSATARASPTRRTGAVMAIGLS